MKIEKVICSKGRTGFFFDDQKAIKAGAKNDGAAYIGQPVTPGFTSIRMAGESITRAAGAFGRPDRLGRLRRCAVFRRRRPRPAVPGRRFHPLYPGSGSPPPDRPGS